LLNNPFINHDPADDRLKDNEEDLPVDETDMWVSWVRLDKYVTRELAISLPGF
jgi:hypothetical protein